MAIPSTPSATSFPAPATTISLDMPRTRARSLTQQTLIHVLRNPFGLIGTLLLTLIVGSAILAPIITPYDPVAQHPGKELLAPGSPFFLGTDELGRDLLSRVLYGTRPSLMVGVIAVAIAATLGCTSGLAAGYFGGIVETLFMRVFDALQAFPPILLGVGIVAALGPSTIDVAYAVAIAGTPVFARLTRSVVLAERKKDYVLAARCLGLKGGRIMIRHVLRNCLGPLLVQIAIFMGVAILAEAGLSFLGIGTQPPLPSWGAMLNESRAYLRTAIWMALWPGIGLATLLISLNYVQDALRDALDPRRVNARQ